MVEKGCGSRLLFALLGLVVLASLTPATAQGKLTKPERRAVDISNIDGASTSSAMLAEISFAGPVGDALGRGALRKAQVKVELLTASGQATVITEGGAPRRPRRSRIGTAGAFELIRGERGLLILVEGLTQPVRQVTVSTGTGAAVAAREVVFDQLSVPIRVIDYEEALRAEQQRVDREIAETESELEGLDKSTEFLIDQIHKSQLRLNHAESGAEASDALAAVKYWKKRLEEVTKRKTELRMKLRALRRWLEILGQIRIIVILPL